MHDHTTTPEEWCPVVVYEGWYEVSNLGRVRRVRRWKVSAAGVGYVLKPSLSVGYPVVALSRNGRSKQRRVHVLVAEAFVPKRYEVNHLDLDRTHNCAANLEWVTSSENRIHGYLRQHPRKTKDGKVYLTPDEVRQVRELAKTMRNIDVARTLGISPNKVSRIVNGLNWAHVV